MLMFARSQFLWLLLLVPLILIGDALLRDARRRRMRLRLNAITTA